MYDVMYVDVNMLPKHNRAYMCHKKTWLSSSLKNWTCPLTPHVMCTRFIHIEDTHVFSSMVLRGRS